MTPFPRVAHFNAYPFSQWIDFSQYPTGDGPENLRLFPLVLSLVSWENSYAFVLLSLGCGGYPEQAPWASTSCCGTAPDEELLAPLGWGATDLFGTTWGADQVTWNSKPLFLRNTNVLVETVKDTACNRVLCPRDFGFLCRFASW